MVYLDIDYMDAYKDFTINEERFPNFKEYVAKKKEEGIRLIPIIDAGVKIEDEMKKLNPVKKIDKNGMSATVILVGMLISVGIQYAGDVYT